MKVILVIFTVLFFAALLYVIASAISALRQRVKEWRQINKDVKRGEEPWRKS
jgi:cell division protein FtsL